MGDELDEKSLLGFVEGEDVLPASSSSSSSALAELDGAFGIGPPKSMLQAPTGTERPPTRSGKCRATFAASGSPALGVSGSGPLFSPSSQRLPDIALDLSPSPAGSPTASSHHNAGGGSAVALPSTSPALSPETKKKSFMMASLAIGLNEIIQSDDSNDGDESGQHAPTKNSGGRSPKKYQLGLPTHALASPKSGSPTTSGSPSPTSGGSKLVPIGGGGSSHALLKFDSIVSSAKGVDDARADSSPNYRKTIASRSPLRDRSILSAESDLHTAPSKLDPLDAENVRCSSLTSSIAATTVISTPAVKAIRLPPNSRIEKPLAASDSKSAPSSPDKPAPSHPMFRNPFKKQSAAGSSPTRDEKKSHRNGDDDEGVDLTVGGSNSQASSSHEGNAGTAAALTPLDELNYLSFSPRATGSSSPFAAAAAKQRDLPSLPLSSDAKDATTASGRQVVQSPRKVKKLKQQQRHEEEEGRDTKSQAK